MTDIASLSFAIDSAQAKQAAAALAAMTTAAGDADQKQKQLTQTTQQYQRDLQSASLALDAWNRSASLAGNSLQSLIDRTHAYAASLTASAAAADKFRQSLNQVIAVSNTFGQSVQGFESYVNAANRLKLSADQIAPSLQRITLAMENQSMIGAQVRQTLQQYGVELNGLRFDQADQALQGFIQRLAQVRDGLQKTRDAQAVLGPIDPDTMRRLSRPDYVPIGVQAQRAQTHNFNVQADRIGTFIESQGYANDQFDKEYNDLRSLYPGASRWTGTRAADLENLRNFAANASTFQKVVATRNPFSVFDSAVVGNNNPLLNEWEYLNSGNFSLNNQAIVEQYRQDRQRMGLFSALGNGIGRGTRNLFGYYTAPEAGDTRRAPLGQGARNLNIETGQSAFLMGLDPRQRAFARYAFGAAGAMGTDTSSIGAGSSMNDFMRTISGDDFRNGSAIMSAFQQGVSGQMQGQHEADQRDIDLQTQLANVVGKGRAAVDDFTKAWQAKTAAQLAGASQDEVVRAGLDAVNKSIAERVTQGRAMLAQMALETDQTRKQIDVVASAATSGDPVTRAAAAYALGIDAQVANATRDNPQLDAGAYRQQLLSSGASKSLLSIASGAANSTDQLGDAASLLGVASSGGNLDLATKSLALQRQYTQEIAQLRANGDQAAIERATQLLQQMQQQLAVSQRIAEQTRNYTEANQMANNGAMNSYIAAQPAGNRAILQRIGPLALQRANDISMRGPTNWFDAPQAQPYINDIQVASARYGVPAQVLAMLFGTESNFNPGATSYAGAKAGFGIAQISEDTAKNVPGYGPVNRANAHDSIMAGSAYLANLAGGDMSPQSLLQAILTYKGASSINSKGLAPQTVRDIFGVLFPTMSGAQVAGMMSPGAMIGAMTPGIGTDPSMTAVGQAAMTQMKGELDLERANIATGSNDRTHAVNAGFAASRAGLSNTAQFIRLGIGSSLDLNNGAKTSAAQSDFLNGLQSAAGGQLGSLQGQIEQANRLAEAELKGQGAVASMTREMTQSQAMRDALGLREADTTNAHKDAIDKYIATLKEQGDEETKLAQAQQMRAVNQKAYSLGNSNELLEAQNSLGPFGSDYSRASAMVPVQTRQFLRDNAPDLIGTDAEDRLNTLTQHNIDLKQTGDLLQDIRSGSSQALDSMTSAFGAAVISGQNLRSVLAGLLQDIAQIALKVGVEKPLGNLLQDGISSLFGGGSSLVPAFGDAAASAAGSMFAGFAAGGVYQRRYFGSGGLFNGPTSFPTTSGPATAGEAGPEAALPLTRLPNGDLGVKTSGGGSGGVMIAPSVTVNVTHQGGGQASDPNEARRMGEMVGQVATQHVNKLMADALRPGGMIWRQMRQNSGNF